MTALCLFSLYEFRNVIAVSAKVGVPKAKNCFKRVGANFVILAVRFEECLLQHVI